MTRKQALQLMGIIGGGVIIGLDNFLLSCKNPENNNINFTSNIISLLDEIGDTIIPTTDSPGAKDAQIGNFMKTIVTDCYDKNNQKIFFDGLNSINEISQKQFHKNFIELNKQERLNLLNQLNKEQVTYQKEINNKFKNDKESLNNAPKHYFTLIKQLTIWGYFTSEIGQTKAMRYTPVPGRRDACIDYKRGDKAYV